MTELTEHAKTILRAIADGKEVQRYTGIWCAAGVVDVACIIDGGDDKHLRIKPETRSINGVEFRAPSGGEYELVMNNRSFWFLSIEDRDIAADIIIQALEGTTK